MYVANLLGALESASTAPASATLYELVDNNNTP